MATWIILRGGIARELKWGHNMFPSQLGIHLLSGKLSITALAVHPNFKGLKEWMDVGFRRCKVVSAQMDVEEPSAASAISSAANKGQSVAMREHEWTALSTINGLVIPINGKYSENAMWQALFERATDVFGVEAVQNESFKYLIQLVHQLRGNQQTYVKELIEFGETMVNTKKRFISIDSRIFVFASAMICIITASSLASSSAQSQSHMH